MATEEHWAQEVVKHVEVAVRHAEDKVEIFNELRIATNTLMNIAQSPEQGRTVQQVAYEAANAVRRVREFAEAFNARNPGES